MNDVTDVLIVQWGKTYAEALQSVCHQAFPNAVIRAACTGAEAMAELRKSPTHILLLSTALPDVDGVDLLPLIADEKLASRVLVALNHPREFSMQVLRTARFDGLIDIMEEDVPALVKALRLVAIREPYISPSLRQHIIERNPPGILAQRLTAAELVVFSEIGDGSGNLEVARRLNLSETTVQTHRRNIMRKLDITSSAKLVREAIRLGMVRISKDGGTIRSRLERSTPAKSQTAPQPSK
ncbi:MAG: response regulator transcription factor [Opitutaceae bacterium]|nr:response regulator transcription factor [Opitutaceae bacterium]